MRYGGHFLIKAEGGAKNYKRVHPLPLAWRSFTVSLAILYRRFRAAKVLHAAKFGVVFSFFRWVWIFRFATWE